MRRLGPLALRRAGAVRRRPPRARGLLGDPPVLLLAQAMQRFLVDDAAVEHVDLAVRVVGVARVVRDDADRRAFGVQLATAGPSPPRRSSNRGYPWARRRAGSTGCRRARARRRRAAADRPTAAPDSDAARCAMPHALERVERALLALGRAHAGAVRERQLDVLEHREVADQVERLEDEADLLVADVRALRRVEVLDRRAVQQIAAAARRVEQPRIDSSVDLPQPDGPAIDR